MLGQETGTIEVQSKPRFSDIKIKILETFGQASVLGQETGTIDPASVGAGLDNPRSVA